MIQSKLNNLWINRSNGNFFAFNATLMNFLTERLNKNEVKGLFIWKDQNNASQTLIFNSKFLLHFFAVSSVSKRLCSFFTFSMTNALSNLWPILRLIYDLRNNILYLVNAAFRHIFYSKLPSQIFVLSLSGTCRKITLKTAIKISIDERFL